MLACDIRVGCWWYGSRGWTFLSIFHYTWLTCDRWQHRGGMRKWCLIWECVRSKCVSPNSSMWKKWHPLTFINTCWTSMETKQWLWAQWDGGWCFEAVATATMGADFYKHGKQALVYACWRCIANGSDYIEKWNFGAEYFLFLHVLVPTK